jgi:hypothetical protein
VRFRRRRRLRLWSRQERVSWASCPQRRRGSLHRYKFDICRLAIDVSIRLRRGIGDCAAFMPSGAFESSQYLRLAIWAEHNAIRQLLVPRPSCYILTLIRLCRLPCHRLLPQRSCRGRDMLLCLCGDF